MSSIYIAAPYPLREQAIDLMCRLESQGHHVTSRWLREVQTGMSHMHAMGDLTDIKAADIFLAYHPEDWHERGTGGRHVEFGYALAHHKQIVLLGKQTNNFHHLDIIRVITRIEDL